MESSSSSEAQATGVNASSILHEVLCFLFQVRQFKVQTVPLHGRFARPRPVSGPSQCASTHPSAAALPTPTAFHSSPAERKRIGVCLWSEGGRERRSLEKSLILVDEFAAGERRQERRQQSISFWTPSPPSLSLSHRLLFSPSLYYPL